MPRTTNLSKPGAMLGAPEPPTDMSPAGRRLWKQTLAVRPAAEWSAADAVLLTLYVRAVLDVERLNGEIAEQGEVLSSPTGAQVVSPLVLVRARRESTLLDCSNRLRLAPSSRYTARRVGELARHAGRAQRAGAAIDADDLLAAPSRGSLQ